MKKGQTYHPCARPPPKMTTATLDSKRTFKVHAKLGLGPSCYQD
jgi:hypothetical protein